MIGLSKEDGIADVIPVSGLDDPGLSLFFVTRKGQVKRTELKEYATSRSGAVAACKVAADDEVLSVLLSGGDQDLMLITREGMSIRFRENEVNPMGRVAGGVKGIQLREGDEVAACFRVSDDEGEVFVLSDLGYGKRSLLLDYIPQSRGGKGVQTFEFKEGKRVKPNGSRIAGAFYCKEPVPVTAITKDGHIFELTTESAPIAERKSIGKLLVSLDKKDEIIQVHRSVD
ncbi:DNA gyrase subunit A [compost metagenome]